MTIVVKDQLCWGANFILMQRLEALFLWHKKVQDDCKGRSVTPIKTNRLCWVLGIPSNFCYFFCGFCYKEIHFLISAKSSSEPYKSLVSWWPHKINFSEAVMEKPQLLGSTWVRKVNRNIQGKIYMTLSSYKIFFHCFLSQRISAWVPCWCLPLPAHPYKSNKFLCGY